MHVDSPDRNATNSGSRVRRAFMWQPRSVVQLWAIWLGAEAAVVATTFLLGWPWQFDLTSGAVWLTWACVQTYGFRHGQLGSRQPARDGGSKDSE